MITEVIPGARSVALGVMVAAGSRHEAPGQHGAAHLLEHLLFRGADGMDSEFLARSLDAFGGESNALTDKETMTAYVRTLPEHFIDALTLLLTITSAPILDPMVVDAERSIVLEELEARDDEAGDVAQMAMEAALFGEHALSRDVLGTVEEIEALERADLRAFHEARYGASTAVIVATGDVEHAAVVEVVGSAFERPALLADVDPPVGRPRSATVVRHGAGQQHVQFGVVTPGAAEDTASAMAVAAHLMGGGVSSRLFREIRDERGLAYGVGADLMLLSDVGVYSAYAAASQGHVAEVIDLLGASFDVAASGQVGRDEVERSKAALRAEILLSADEPLSRLGRLGSDHLSIGRIRSVEERLAEIGAVTTDAVSQALHAFGTAERHGIVVGNPTPDVRHRLEERVGL